MLIKGFFATLLLLGLALSGFGIYFIALGNEARNWPAVEGQVVTSVVRTEILQLANAPVTAEARERRRRYYPQITYRWGVDGMSYTGSRYQLGDKHDTFETREEAQIEASKYPSGSAIPVYYDPKSPSEAVLDKSRSVGVFVPLILGLLFLSTGALGWRYRAAIQRAYVSGAGADLS